MLYRLLALVGLMASFPLSGQLSTRLLLHDQTYLIDEGDFSAAAAGADAYDAVTDRLYGVLHYAQTPDASELNELKEQGVHFNNALPLRSYLIDLPLDAWPLDGSTAMAFTALPTESRRSKNMKLGNYPEHMMKTDGRAEMELSLANGPSWTSSLEAINTIGFEVLETDRSIGRVRVLGSIDRTEQLIERPFVFFIAEALPLAEKENDLARSNHRVSYTQQQHPTYDGRDVVVGVGDDREIGPHIDFEGRIITDYSQPGSASNTHGDHVSGTVLGAGNIDPFAKGMAPGAKLVYYPPVGSGHFQRIDSDYAQYQVFIHNSSYSGGCNSGYNSQAAELDQNSVDHRSYLHVFSAGNNGNSPCSNAYIPGVPWGNITGGHKLAKNVVATANLTDFDIPASSSSKGPATDGRIKPDIAAVGTQVYSTGPDNTYFNATGTSMAAPGAAGTLAVLYSAYKQTHSNMDPAGGLMKNILMNTADDRGNPGPDFQYGYGRINARHGVEVIENDRFSLDTIAQGQTNTHTLTVPAGLSKLKVMVNWVDPQGFVGSARNLINDLNITLTAPDGNQLLPWVLDPTPNITAITSNAVRAIDSLNNAEQVTLDFPVAGTYTLSVNGSTIPFGSQEYFFSYHFVQDVIAVEFPAGGECIAPFQPEVIRWAAPDGTGTFLVEFTPDDGQNWFTVSANVPANERHFSWSGPPNLYTTDQARIRVTRGGQSGQSGKFQIFGRPGNLSVVRSCPDSTRFTWNAVPNATHYEFLTMGDRYMDSLLAVVDTNYASFSTIDAGDELWVSVRAFRDSTLISERADGLFKPLGLSNCVLQNDMAIEEILWPGRGLQDCQSQSIVPKVRISNSGSNPAFGFDVDIHYSGPGLNGTQSMTVTDTLQPGQVEDLIFSTALNFNSGTFAVSAVVDLPNDNNALNDSAATDILISVGSGAVSFPDSNDLDNFIACPTATDCGATSCALSDGFQNLPNNVTGGDDIDWRTHSGSTASNNTGPSFDHSTGTAAGNYLYLEASNGCQLQEAVLTSPCIDLSTAVLPKFKFWYHMYGTAIGELHVDVIAGGQLYPDVVPSISGDQGDQWRPLEIDLSPYNGGLVNVRIRGITGGGWQGDIAIDHFVWTEVNSAPIVDFGPAQSVVCPGETVQFNDASSNGPSQWEWKVFPNTVNFVNGTNSSSQNPSIQFTNFGTYSIRLIATNAFGTDSVEYSQAVRIDAPATFLSEDFENLGGGFPPFGFEVVNPDNDDTWGPEYANGIAGGTSRVAGIGNFSYNAPGEEDWLVTPRVSIPSTGGMYLKWDIAYAYYSNTYSDGMEIRVSTDCGKTFPDVLYSKSGSDLATAGSQTSDWAPAGPSEWRRDSLSLDNWSGQEVRIAFVNINGYGNNLYLDNLNIYEPGILAPTASIDQSDTVICSGASMNFQVPNPSSSVTYNWDFGAGAAPATAFGPGPHSVTYGTSGNKNIDLSAGNTGGQTTVSSNLQVIPGTDANFSYAQGASYLEYNFTSLAAGSGTLTYNWDFGDGNSSSAANPTHTYSATGTYTVVQNVDSDCGSDQTSVDLVVTNIGLQEILQRAWSIYPNPADASLTIEIQHKEADRLRLVDMSGRLLKEVQLPKTMRKMELSLEELSSGVYMLQLISPRGLSVKRFQKN